MMNEHEDWDSDTFLDFVFMTITLIFTHIFVTISIIIVLIWAQITNDHLKHFSSPFALLPIASPIASPSKHLTSSSWPAELFGRCSDIRPTIFTGGTLSHPNPAKPISLSIKLQSQTFPFKSQNLNQNPPNQNQLYPFCNQFIQTSKYKCNLINSFIKICQINLNQSRLHSMPRLLTYYQIVTE